MGMWSKSVEVRNPSSIFFSFLIPYFSKKGKKKPHSIILNAAFYSMRTIFNFSQNNLSSI